MSTKQELGPNQKAWVAAMRSGDYQQCAGALSKIRNGSEFNCCLGVGCRVMEMPRCHIGSEFFVDGGETYGSLAPPSLVQHLALRSTDGVLNGYANCLVAMNDNRLGFAEIADFCEAHPEAVFVEPR